MFSRGGRGGRGRGSAGRGDGAPRRDLIAIRAEEGLGQHWSYLYRLAADAIDYAERGSEYEPYRAVIDNLHYLSRFPRAPDESDHELMVRLLAHFLQLVGSVRLRSMTADDAVFWLTEAEWNEETAMNNILAAEERGQNPEAASESGMEVSDSDAPVPDNFNDLPENYREINRLNPKADRAPAVKGRKNVGKFTISLRRPEGKGSKDHCFKKYDNGANMDWNNPAHIRELNRWRTQQLRRDLGPVRQGRIYFHEDERLWLTELYRSTKQSFTDEGLTANYRTMNWDELTADFNHLFADQILERGGQPRPYRSKASIMTERYRIPELCKLAGLRLKVEKKTNEPEPEPAPEQEAEDVEMEDGSDEESRGGKGSKPVKRGGRGGKRG